MGGAELRNSSAHYRAVLTPLFSFAAGLKDIRTVDISNMVNPINAGAQTLHDTTLKRGREGDGDGDDDGDGPTNNQHNDIVRSLPISTSIRQALLTTTIVVLSQTDSSDQEDQNRRQGPERN